MSFSLRIFFKSFIDFFRDDGPMLAGSISYFFVMAIFPFCLFLVSIFGYFLGENREFYNFFLEKLIYFFPEATSEITKELGTIITYRKIGLFTLLLYGFFSYQLYLSAEKAINVIFKERATRPFLISTLLSLSIVTLMITLIIITFGAISIIPMFKFLTNFLPGLVISKITIILVGFILPLFLVTVIATSFYIFLPKKNVKTRHALIGGLFTALFLEAAKHLFTFYIALKLSNIGTIYGSLSAFIIFVLWVFYSASIFLIGGEVVHNLGTAKSSDHPS
ncbi:MAG: YihY/virulence factor BrkB family protein [Nitrospirae bacterium]|nr:YihY/virulence factor BrkB family protein [Nitrospirota bacterium]